MKQKMLDLLEPFCPGNVYLQGTLDAAEAYPDTFLTVWTNYTDDRAHYDDARQSVDWNFTVILYSVDPAVIASLPARIGAAAKSAGFLPQGKGNDIPSDRPSHTGWTMEFVITEFI